MRRILISLTVIALLFIPQFAAGDDLDDLKAADALGEKLTLSLDPNDAEGCCQFDCVKFFSANFLRKGRFSGTCPMGFFLQWTSIFKQTKARSV